MWSALIKSAPDFLFDVLETRAFYDPSTFHMIVASKFSWFGTRVMDVKYTTKVAVATEGTTEGTKAVEETASNTLATKEDIKTTETNSAIDESIFSSATSNEFDTEAASGIPSSAELNSTGKFYVDAIPLQQKLQMSCNGTFLVYINTDYLQEALKKQQQTADEASTPVPNIPIDPAHIGKIFKLEFIYTSSDEKLI